MPPQIGNCVPIWEDLIPKVRFEETLATTNKKAYSALI
jgi:hypothetical protein